MDNLSPDLLQQINNVFSRINKFVEEAGRRAMLIEAFGTSHPLLELVVYGDPRGTFQTLLIQTLLDYGDDTLGRLLIICKRSLGEDRGREIDALLADMSGGTVGMQPPVSEFNTRLYTLTAPGGTMQLDGEFYIPDPARRRRYARLPPATMRW